MLEVFQRISTKIHTAERKEDRLYLCSEAFQYRLEPKSENIVHISVTKKEGFHNGIEAEKPGVCFSQVNGDWEFEETGTEICLKMKELRVVIDRETGSFTYFDAEGGLLLRENPENSKELEEFMSYRLAEGGSVRKETIETADGKKEVIRSADRVEAEELYHTRLHLEWQPDERLYGLGQQEEGFCNLRGQTVYVHQANRKIAIPLLVSSAGYGILMDTYSPMIFNDTVYGSYLYTEADMEMDFYFINGRTPDGVIREYRRLTGKAALLPKWAYGYLQSQERYETQDEILEMAREYRARELGLDGLVLDWLSWEDGKWGQKSFDRKRFPDAREMTDKLHKQDVHFMISVWPNMDPVCEDHQEFQEKGLFLPGSNIYNALDPAGRKLYWSQLERNLYSKGVDAWWCDSSEPYTYEWNRIRRPEPAELFAEYCRETADHIPAWQTNAFALYHAMGIYEGQRGASVEGSPEKRVFNLTRSAYTGQQRYGTVMWSGDTGASWGTLQRQIAAGLSFSASGMPYWTADIGAFFVKTGEHWYWDGEYPDAAEDLGYRELFVRWYQWGCFLPIFRGHGTDCRRELWNFGQEGEPFYDALVKMNRLRYLLMPYIYSTAGQVWREDASFIRMLAFAFPEDAQAAEITDQYLFGDRLLVCPVTSPMYYDRGSKAIEDAAKTRRVYLPAGQGWYDFWTNCYYEGGQWIEAEAELDRIPLYVKDGTILPVTKPEGEGQEFRDGEEFLEKVASGRLNGLASTAQCRRIALRVYAKQSADFTLYEDAGDGYGYECGEYSLRRLRWDGKSREIVTEQLHGDKDADYVAAIDGLVCC